MMLLWFLSLICYEINSAADVLVFNTSGDVIGQFSVKLHEIKQFLISLKTERKKCNNRRTCNKRKRQQQHNFWATMLQNEIFYDEYALTHYPNSTSPFYSVAEKCRNQINVKVFISV